MGSYLGILWVLIRPLIFIAAIWFVFSFGLKITFNSEVPFLIYLLTGYIPWIFFSEAVTEGMNAIIANRFLVKKVYFRVSILPIVALGKVFILHLIFLVLLISILFLYGIKPTVYWVQLPFYTLAMIILILGISLFLSSIRVFVKDIAYIVSLLMQLGIWITPVFWSIQTIPNKYIHYVQINPLVYLVEGYRNCFINKVWFWEDTTFLFGYLAYTFFFFFGGIIVFRKLKPHFGDVL